MAGSSSHVGIIVLFFLLAYENLLQVRQQSMCKYKPANVIDAMACQQCPFGCYLGEMDKLPKIINGHKSDIKSQNKDQVILKHLIALGQ